MTALNTKTCSNTKISSVLNSVNQALNKKDGADDSHLMVCWNNSFHVFLRVLIYTYIVPTDHDKTAML